MRDLYGEIGGCITGKGSGGIGFGCICTTKESCYIMAVSILLCALVVLIVAIFCILFGR